MYNQTIVSESMLYDYNLIMNAETLICSNSSFCFWPALFSKANVIYCPVKRNNSSNVFLSVKNAIHLDYHVINIFDL